MSKREQVAFKIPIHEFSVSSLSPSVKAKWQPFGREPGGSEHEKRSLALKDASFCIYRTFEEVCSGLSSRACQACSSYCQHRAVVVQEYDRC